MSRHSSGSGQTALMASLIWGMSINSQFAHILIEFMTAMGVETRKSQACFQIIKSNARLAEHKTQII